MTSAHPVTTPQPLLRQDHDPINGYQEQENLSSKLHQASSSSTLPSFVFFKAVQDHGGICYRGSQHLQHALEDGKMSSNAPVGLTMIKKGQNCGDLKDCNVSGSQVKWMPSMRMLRKMMNDSDDRPSKSAHQLLLPEKDPIHNSGTPSAPQETVINGRCSNGNDTVRVCADCNTSRTPLWRSGPRGPKSLCNACGIRQRKARRRAMAAAAAASTDGTILPPVATPSAKFMAMKNKGNKRSRAKAGYRELETKKRFKINPANDNSLLAHHKGKKQLCLEDFAASLNLHRSAKFQRVFPQEEKEAAILLMALSCGSVRG